MIYLIEIIFCIWFLKRLLKVKEGQVVLIFANIRTGKTTLLARYAKREKEIQKKKNSKWRIIRWLYRKKPLYKHIVSNTPIEGCTYIPNIREIFQKGRAPEFTLILVDEGYLVWPNRKTKGIEPITDEEIEYMKLIGHYDSKLIIVSQSYEDIDIIIRRIYTSMFLLKKFLSITLIRPIKKYITIDEETHQIVDAYKFMLFLRMGFIFRHKYYSMFDTKWKPDGREHPDYTPYKIVEKKKKGIDKHSKKWNFSLKPLILLNKVKSPLLGKTQSTDQKGTEL